MIVQTESGHSRADYHITKKLRILSVLPSLLAVGVMVSSSGCATPYQKMGWKGGYDDYRITEDTFEVKFAGNGYTRPEQVRKYVLRRAAEVTLLHDFAHFLPLGQADESRQMTIQSSSGQVHAYGGYQGGYAYGSSTGCGGDGACLRRFSVRRSRTTINGSYG